MHRHFLECAQPDEIPEARAIVPSCVYNYQAPPYVPEGWTPSFHFAPENRSFDQASLTVWPQNSRKYVEYREMLEGIPSHAHVNANWLDRLLHRPSEFARIHYEGPELHELIFLGTRYTGPSITGECFDAHTNSCGFEQFACKNGYQITIEGGELVRTLVWQSPQSGSDQARLAWSMKVIPFDLYDPRVKVAVWA